MSSIWMSETTPEEFQAECPHVACQRAEPHEGHGWRGTRREFGGAVEVMRTYWCPGVSESPAEPRTGPRGHNETPHATTDAQEASQ